MTVIVTLSGRRRCVSASERMACSQFRRRTRRRRPRQSLATPRWLHPIGIETTTTSSPFRAPRSPPFHHHHDAHSILNTMLQAQRPCKPPGRRLIRTVQFSTVQHRNLTLRGAHAHAPSSLDASPAIAKMTRSSSALSWLSIITRKGWPNVLAALAGHWQLCLSSFLGSPDVKKLRSASSFQGSWPVIACGLDMSNLRRKL
jgi:hypothetical protein